jgi:hypothetical protein
VIELRDTVAIEAGPSEVWAWLESLPDHLSAAWVRGRGRAPGAVMQAEEDQNLSTMLARQAR